MSKLGIFMAAGCEECEALIVVDLIRRAGMEIEMIAVDGAATVTGSHNITIAAEVAAEAADYSSYDGIVLPGGVPGVHNLAASERVLSTVKAFAQEGKMVAAVCAGPSVLGLAGVLEGKHATCHPGWEEKLTGAVCETDKVVRDGNVITSRGMGTSIDFALEIIRYFKDDESAQKVAAGLVYCC